MPGISIANTNPGRPDPAHGAGSSTTSTASRPDDASVRRSAYGQWAPALPGGSGGGVAVRVHQPRHRQAATATATENPPKR